MMQDVSSGNELKLGCLIIDLASFSSVKEFAKMFKEKNLPLHILINNAAMCGVPYQRTEDDIELQVQVSCPEHIPEPNHPITTTPVIFA